MKYRPGQGFPLKPIVYGLRKRCPSCGQSPIFKKYLQPVKFCNVCKINIGQHRTDDLAPYITILIVGHIVAPMLLLLEKLYDPPLWVHYSIWPILTIILTLWFLQRVKGAAIALMWHLNLNGDEFQ